MLCILSDEHSLQLCELYFFFDLNNNLLFDWNASDHLNITDYQSTLFIGNSIPGQIAWMHGNSIDVDYDDNLILSNRKSSEIIKINRNNGEVIWIMGGPLNEFQIINDSLNGTAKQHDVTRLDNGNILVFDNGENNTHPASRVVEYEIDENNKVASLVWEFFNPYGYISRAMGSAQRLPNGNTLINWGTVLVEGTNVGANIIERINLSQRIKSNIKGLVKKNHYSVKFLHIWVSVDI